MRVAPAGTMQRRQPGLCPPRLACREYDRLRIPPPQPPLPAQACTGNVAAAESRRRALPITLANDVRYAVGAPRNHKHPKWDYLITHPPRTAEQHDWVLMGTADCRRGRGPRPLSAELQVVTRQSRRSGTRQPTATCHHRGCALFRVAPNLGPGMRRRPRMRDGRRVRNRTRKPHPAPGTTPGSTPVTGPLPTGPVTLTDWQLTLPIAGRKGNAAMVNPAAPTPPWLTAGADNSLTLWAPVTGTTTPTPPAPAPSWTTTPHSWQASADTYSPQPSP